MLTLPVLSMPSARLTVAVSLLIGVSFAQQAAFAQKAEFEETKPHLNVGTIGHLDVQPRSDIRTELLVLVTPELVSGNLRDGLDVALVHVDLAGSGAGVCLLRLYGFENGFVTTLVNRRGDEIEFVSEVLTVHGEPDSVAWHGFGTQLSFTPTVLDKDRIRLQVTPALGEFEDD